MHAGVSVSLESGEQLRAPILVGADGVRSRVAANLGLKEPNYAGYIAYRCACQFLHMHMQICWVAGLPSYLECRSHAKVSLPECNLLGMQYWQKECMQASLSVHVMSLVYSVHALAGPS